MSRKPFTVGDHGLWDEVARSIEPLKRRKPKAVLPQGRAALGTDKLAARQVETVLPRATAKPHKTPPLAAFDRRTAQRLSRGQDEPDARIDLHGEGVETARIRLLHFLSHQRHRGLRMVLVITGKGASPFARHTLHGTTHFHAPEREGRLRRELGHWLNEEQFRSHVVGYQPAHPRHGGGGAFYVRLRRLASRDHP